ncbi:helix-turn-helix domain-containing protein [Beutenbergia cavernae]|uniref:helix-turn-helix domain-containing protein n=1 Tax=Beutenbergia cavernae TaxID=84757 RepID=UPI00019AC5FF
MTEQSELERSAARLAVDAVATMNRARETACVSQRDLAHRLGVGESRVSQILNGDGNVRMATLARVLRALGYGVQLQVAPISDDLPVIPRRQGRRRRSQVGAASTWDGQVTLRDVPDTVPPTWSNAPLKVSRAR